MRKLLVTSSFSFTHNVFHSYISLVHQNAALCGKRVKRIVRTREIFNYAVIEEVKVYCLASVGQFVQFVG